MKKLELNNHLRTDKTKATIRGKGLNMFIFGKMFALDVDFKIQNLVSTRVFIDFASLVKIIYS